MPKSKYDPARILTFFVGCLLIYSTIIFLMVVVPANQVPMMIPILLVIWGVIGGFGVLMVYSSLFRWEDAKT